MPLPWLELQQMTDDVVDTFLGEAVELYPWAGGGYASSGQRDESRPIVRTTGILVTPGAAVTGEGGTAGGFDARVVENATWLSIQEDLVGDLSSWRKGDRVYFPDRGVWYEITHQAPSATRRPNIHLVRVNPAP